MLSLLAFFFLPTQFELGSKHDSSKRMAANANQEDMITGLGGAVLNLLQVPHSNSDDRIQCSTHEPLNPDMRAN